MGLKVYNPYYDAEKLGLTIVAELEYSDQSYCFDTRVVWKDAKGTLWTARDTGCSCPSPFEGERTLDRCFLKDLKEEYRKEPDYNLKNVSVQDFQTFYDKIKSARA